MTRRAALRSLVLLGLSLLFAACSSDKPKPTPLQNYTPKISATQVWRATVDSIGFGLLPTVRDGVLFLASSDGDVTALRTDTGAIVWRTSAQGRIAAGVGSDGRYTSVVTRGNEVVTFDGPKEVWRQRVPSAVVTPPLVAGERVFVLSVDRAVRAFDERDGRRLWSFERPGDALTLSEPGVVVPFHNTLLVGQGPRLTALDPLRGTEAWSVPMASPRGSNEVERLADLVGPPVRLGDRFCVRAFQSAVACADAAQGTLLWSRNAGGMRAVAGDADVVVGADASDRITAWRAATGDILWTNEKLLYRGLSGALAAPGSIVFGDADGWVHFLSPSTGELQLRLPTNGKPVIGTPVLSGDLIIVVSRNGDLFAFRRT